MLDDMTGALALLEHEIAARLQAVDRLKWSDQQQADARQAILDEAAFRRDLIRRGSDDDAT